MLSKLLTFQNPWMLIVIIIVFGFTIYCAVKALECDE